LQSDNPAVDHLILANSGHCSAVIRSTMLRVLSRLQYGRRLHAEQVWTPGEAALYIGNTASFPLLEYDRLECMTNCNITIIVWVCDCYLAVKVERPVYKNRLRRAAAADLLGPAARRRSKLTGAAPPTLLSRRTGLP